MEESALSHIRTRKPLPDYDLTSRTKNIESSAWGPERHNGQVKFSTNCSLFWNPKTRHIIEASRDTLRIGDLGRQVLPTRARSILHQSRDFFECSEDFDYICLSYHKIYGTICENQHSSRSWGVSVSPSRRNLESHSIDMDNHDQSQNSMRFLSVNLRYQKSFDWSEWRRIFVKCHALLWLALPTYKMLHHRSLIVW
jgi:hypothetical protein